MKANSDFHPFGVFLEGTFSFLLFTVFIITKNITSGGMMGWNKGIETSLIYGGVILFIGALPLYILTVTLLRVVGNARTLSYGPFIYVGALFGLIWLPLFELLRLLLKDIAMDYIEPMVFLFYLLMMSWILGATLSALIISLFMRNKSARNNNALG